MYHLHLQGGKSAQQEITLQQGRILIYPPTYVFVFLVVSFLLVCPPLSYTQSSSSHQCYMPCPSHTRFNHCSYTWLRVQVMKLLLMQFSPFPHHLIPLRTKYPPQYSALKHPQCQRPVSHQYRTTYPPSCILHIKSHIHLS
jgi:hypothetical protein